MMTETQSFLWGVATSAYQSEGGYNGPGEPLTNWAAAEQRGDVAEAGPAAEFWTLYEADFARCREMGLSAFRMGIEWSRVQPVHTEARLEEPPPLNFAALDHYARMLAACRAAGMEPVVTLHHFVHPAWLGTDPWLDARTPALFAQYVERAVGHLNRCLRAEHGQAPLKFFITINEPNMLVLNTYAGRQFPATVGSGLHAMTSAYNQLLIAHVLAYNRLHDLYEREGWGAPMVTFNNYCSDVYWSDKFLLDLMTARERGTPRNGIKEYIHGKIDEFEAAFRAARIPLRKGLAFAIGTAFKHLTDVIGWRWFQPAHFTPLLDAIYASPRDRLLDYIGLDYYDPFAAHAFRLPVFSDHEFKSRTFRAWITNVVTSKWWDWRVLPDGLRFFCSYYARDYGRPVLIAENGMALRRKPDNRASFRKDRMLRSQFLKMHVQEVVRIVNDGVPLIGYLHWSLFDNYEWGSYTPRFGLFSLDYAHNRERLVEDHYGDRPSVAYAALIRDARDNMHEPAAVAS
ncbi:MAG: family 1 glycosylhydrolase [Prosthecobacter sp.]|nr:family 1 glycosylhydrolase [Prosthecobacter sp.]